ncbi:MAG: hypothetical protein VR65_07665 [Desulfobulbaceae bacterium BRH_c16a]|nr:MAG: hypothetical protein VR65_07665 [Desulfobulbaceae bacterium BRH_c16a]
MEFKDLWDVESAMKVLTHKTVDGKLWAEAVEWLIIYGPAEIRQLLLESSMTAASSSFPELKPSRFTPDGQPCYTIEDLAKALHMDVKEATKLLRQKEAEHEIQNFFDETGSGSVH